MITKKQYEIIDNWNNKKSFKNFCLLYKYGFTYKYLFIRPLWRLWRIFRNTCINKKYLDIYTLDEQKLI